jgi:hypothetical protein
MAMVGWLKRPKTGDKLETNWRQTGDKLARTPEITNSSGDL